MVPYITLKPLRNSKIKLFQIYFSTIEEQHHKAFTTQFSKIYFFKENSTMKSLSVTFLTHS